MASFRNRSGDLWEHRCGYVTAKLPPNGYCPRCGDMFTKCRSTMPKHSHQHPKYRDKHNVKAQRKASRRERKAQGKGKTVSQHVIDALKDSVQQIVREEMKRAITLHLGLALTRKSNEFHLQELVSRDEAIKKLEGRIEALQKKVEAQSKYIAEVSRVPETLTGVLSEEEQTELDVRNRFSRIEYDDVPMHPDVDPEPVMVCTNIGCKNEAGHPHPCPFDAHVAGTETLCECCSECEEMCQDSI